MLLYVLDLISFYILCGSFYIVVRPFYIVMYGYYIYLLPVLFDKNYTRLVLIGKNGEKRVTWLPKDIAEDFKELNEVINNGRKSG